MEGVIAHFRRGRRTQTNNQMIIYIDGIDSREKAGKITGKMVTFKTEGGKEINGKVAAAHGNKGAVRVIFERGMPGQSLGEMVNLN